MSEVHVRARNRAGVVVAGRYRLDRLLAVGGMGAVYEATHVVTNKRFAVKLMHPGTVADASARERFLREAQAPAGIGHPDIVDVLDAGTDDGDGSLFLAMELLEGESLTRWARREDVTRLDALERVLALCDPLAAAHARGFVHRDLKPDNVLVVRDARGTERVKLLDFGIARREHAESLTRHGSFLGTLRYVSPEQARTPQRATAAADVWSVGAMIYELCSGSAPFEGDDTEVVLAAAKRPHRALVAVDPSVPRSLSGLVDRCLSKKPEDRPRDAAELATALASVLRDPAAAAALRTPLPAPPEQAPSHVRASARTLEPQATTDESERTDVSDEGRAAPTRILSDDLDDSTDVAPTRAGPEPLPAEEATTNVLAAPSARGGPAAARAAFSPPGEDETTRRPASRGSWRANVPGLVLVGVSILLASAVIAVTRSKLRDEAADAQRAAPRTDTYRVAVSVQPAGASLRLDGEPVAGPIFVRDLPRDGRAHRLEASAPGFVPGAVAFRDAPPPGELLLSPVPVAPIAPVVDARDPSTATARPAAEPPAPAATGRGSRPSPRPGEISPSARPIRYGANKAPVIR